MPSFFLVLRSRATLAIVALLCLPTILSCDRTYETKARITVTDSAASGQVKNVILISIDTCRADHLSCYGFDKKTTPNIDVLASEGTLFERAVTTNPITLPSHSSILTGTYPTSHGVRDNHDYNLHPSRVTIAEMVKELGLQTSAFVSAFPLAAGFGLNQGFDVYDEQFGERETGREAERLERTASETTAAAIAWLEMHHASPFLMFIHYFDPHASYTPPADFAERFPGNPYAAEIAFTDDQIGELVARLQALGLYDSTMIVVTSDHGESLDEHDEETHSYFIYQSVQHVPLVMRVPGNSGGRRVKDTVSVVDIVPTILTALGVEIPEQVQGTDLNPYLSGGAPEEQDRIAYSESLVPTIFECAPLRSVTDNRWQYIHTARPELYDLRADPGQLNNVIDDHAAVASGLHTRLMDLVHEPIPAFVETSTDQASDFDEADRARMESLGYIGGGVNEAIEFDEETRDPKDFIKQYRALMRAEGLLGEGRYDASRKVCETLLASEPNVFRAHQLLAKIAEWQKRPKDAIGHYRDGLEAFSRTSEDTAESDQRAFRDVIRAHSNIAEHLFLLGKPAEALKQYEAGLRDFPNSVRLLSHSAALMTRLASESKDEQKKKQMLQKAIDSLTRAVEIEPKNSETHNLLGYAHLTAGDVSLAKQHVQQAILLNPGNMSARRNLQHIRMLPQ